MSSASTDFGPVEYTPESSPYDEIIMRQEANALERVGNLPLVASTWGMMSSYYASAKKTYPFVTPYLEFAEKMTSGAASVALSTTKPVVDKLAPTVNSYANRGLDKLEGALPQICDEPDEIYGSAKAALASAVTRRIDSALLTTENYIDYYLPPMEGEVDDETEENESDDDESESSSTASSDLEDVISHKEHLQVISNKVRQRAYRRAMSKFCGVQKRSVDTLNRLQFTVDLIRYAKDNMDSTREKVTSTVSAANDTINQGIASSQENLIAAWEEIKTRSSDAVAEVHLFERAQFLTKRMQESCSTLLAMASKIPDGEYWTKKIAWAKDSLDALVRDITGKVSLSDLSYNFIETAQKNIQQAKQLIDGLFTLFIEHGPMKWLGLKMVKSSVTQNEEVTDELDTEKEKEE